MDSRQPSSHQFKSHLQINKFFVKNTTNIIINNEKLNKYAGLGFAKEVNKNFVLPEKQTKEMYKTYLKKKDVLGRNKFARKNYAVVCQATLCLSKLLLSYSGIQIIYKMSKQNANEIAINITCTLLESKDHSRLLFDVSGNKDRFHRTMIQTLIDKMRTDKTKYIAIVQELEHLLKQHHLSAEIIESVSANTRNTIFLEKPFCSEKSTHPEIEKNYQLLNQDQKMKVSVAHFKLVVGKQGNFCFIKGLFPNESCNSCQKDKKAGFYAARNSWVGEDGRVNCEIKPKKIGSIGNIGFEPLSPRRSIPLFPADIQVYESAPMNLPINPIPKEAVINKLAVEVQVTTKQSSLQEQTHTLAKKMSSSVTDAIGDLIKSVPNFTKFFPSNSHPGSENEKSIDVERKTHKPELPKTVNESVGNLVTVLKCNKNEIAQLMLGRRR